MAGKFVISKRSNGEFQFNLKAGNGQVILASEGHSSPRAARTASNRYGGTRRTPVFRQEDRGTAAARTSGSWRVTASPSQRTRYNKSTG